MHRAPITISLSLPVSVCSPFFASPPFAATTMPPSSISTRVICEPTPIANHGQRQGRDRGCVPLLVRIKVATHITKAAGDSGSF